MELFDIDPGQSVMAIFAHPDDAETAAGGTLAQYARSGAHIDLVTIARGEKGRGESVDRESESQRAAEILGVTSSQSFGYNDGEFDNDLELRKRITETIRASKPNVVICSDPTAVFFSHAYVNHRDHRQTGWAVIDVVSSAVANPKYFSSSPAHHVEHLLCAGSLNPNCAVDITQTMDEKIHAVQCYKSQIGDRPDSVSESLRSTAQTIGHEIGVGFGEAFRYCALDAPMEQI